MLPCAIFATVVNVRLAFLCLSANFSTVDSNLQTMEPLCKVGQPVKSRYTIIYGSRMRVSDLDFDGVSSLSSPAAPLPSSVSYYWAKHTSDIDQSLLQASEQLSSRAFVRRQSVCANNINPTPTMNQVMISIIIGHFEPTSPGFSKRVISGPSAVSG